MTKSEAPRQKPESQDPGLSFHKMNNDLKYLIALLRFRKFGAKRTAYLRNFFSSWQDSFQATLSELIEAGIDPKVAEEFVGQRSLINPEQELELLPKHDINLIPFGDPAYPKHLATIYDPPAALFVRGTLPEPNINYFSVVGTRKITRYGEQAIYELVPSLAEAGLVIASGLALGVDTAAHKATLMNNGKTTAILPGGIDNDSIVPKQNLVLAEEIIASGGALVSEFPPGTNSFKGSFPFRNRIISGLSHGTLVIEAAERSGSLITAKSALEQGRDVFAVPGPITSPTSTGPNNLIKMGATPTTEPGDILNHYDITDHVSDLPAIEPTDKIEADIFMTLSKDPLHVDLIVKATKLSAAKVTGTLTLMEMKGMIRHLGGMHYVKK